MATGNQGATLPGGSYNAYTTNRGDLVISGARKSTDVAAARRRVQFTGEIKINENIRPLTWLMTKLGGRNQTVGQSVVQHNERDMTPTTVILDNAGYNGAVTTINFLAGTGAQVRPGTVLKSFRTGEIIWVVSKTDVDTAVVKTRGFLSSSGGVAGAALLASEELQILGTNFGQNSPAPAGISNEPLIKYAYLQTFRTCATEASGRDLNSDVYGKGEEARQLEDSKEWHDTCVEKAFLFNQGYYATDGAGDAATPEVGTMTDGLINQIVTNLFHVGGDLDETTWNEYIIAVTRYNAGDKTSLVTFFGEYAARALQGFARDGMRYGSDDKIFGVDVQGWKTFWGTMPLKLHGLYSPIGSSETAANGAPVGMLTTVNFKNLGKLTYKNRAFKLEKNIQIPGYDGKKDGWTEDVGLEMWNERSHGHMDGITG